MPGYSLKQRGPVGTLAQSMSLFLGGIIKRFYLWTPIVVLDPFDLNQKLVQPMLPEAWKFQLPWSPDWAPVVLIGLIFWAAVLTFHEHRRYRPGRPDWDENDVAKYLLASSKMMMRLSTNDRLINKIELSIRDAARCGTIRVWGRPRRNPGGVTPATEQPIPENYWEHGRFNIYKGLTTDGKGRNVRRVNIEGTRDYSDLKFNRKEIMMAWPKTNFLQRMLDIGRYDRVRLTTGTRVKNGTR